MTSSDNVQIPKAQLHSIGTNLNSVKSDMEGVENAIIHLGGVDSVHGSKIQASVASFFEEWKTSRRTLMDNIGGLGDVSTQIAEVTEEFDSEVASGLTDFANKLRSGGEGSGSGSGGRAVGGPAGPTMV